MKVKPDAAEELFKKTEQDAMDKLAYYQSLVSK